MGWDDGGGSGFHRAIRRELVFAADKLSELRDEYKTVDTDAICLQFILSVLKQNEHNE